METHATDQAGFAGHGAKRRRPFLASLATLGVATSLLGVAGVFAASTDSARTELNDAFSGQTGGGGGDGHVDLQLATASMDYETSTFTCNDDWSDNLASGVINSGGNELGTDFPGYGPFDEGYLCIRNIGDDPAAVSMTASDLVDSEVFCSPGEATAPDPTCGTGEGELSHDLVIAAYTAVPGVEANNCISSAATSSTLRQLYDGDAIGLESLSPGQVIGLCPGAFWSASAVSQSDHATWRFVFNAIADTEPDPTACAGEDGFEENDSFETATPYTQPITAFVCPTDGDVYAYQHDGGALEAALDIAEEATVDLDLGLYDTAGNQIGVSISETSDEAIVIEDLPAGTYYVVVAPFADATGAYTLSVTSILL